MVKKKLLQEIDNPNLSIEKAKLINAKLEAQKRAMAWVEGDLEYKLKPHQIELYNSLISAIENPDCLKYVVNSSRRFGKSFVLCLIACQFALQFKNVYIRFAAPTRIQIKEILHQHMKTICQDAPSNIKPIFKGHQGKYVFPSTGSEITFAGTDLGNAENLRGNASHLNIVDEAASMSDLLYVLNDILLPQTLTTKGTTLIASTPPRSPSHEFCDIAREAELTKFYSKYTIWDNTSIAKEDLTRFIEAAGGIESTTFKREYMCEFIVDSNLALCREWNKSYVIDENRTEFYNYYDRYVSMDIGVRDFTAILFGYYDFMQARLYIQDEVTIKGQDVTTPNISKAIKDKEVILWSTKPPRKRIADNNNLILLQDLETSHKLPFMATNKDQLEAMVNELRMWVGAGKVIIDSKCTYLIGCLEYGIWDAGSNKSKVYKGFARASGYGHFDHLAALIYMIRNIDVYNNPIPMNLGKTMENSMLAYQKGAHYKDTSTAVFADLYGSRRDDSN